MQLATKQQEAYNLALAGEDLFITGKAGTGKSFLVKLIIEALEKEGKNVAVLATTGVAASNIKGQTIHSFFKIKPFGICKPGYPKSEQRDIFLKTDVLVIDEVSMLRPDQLDAVHQTLVKAKCGGLPNYQIIFIGDMAQLQPIIQDTEVKLLSGLYGTNLLWQSAKVYKALQVNELCLDHIFRQSDQEFIKALNIIREGGKSDYFKRFISTEVKGIVLCPTNKLVDQYNSSGLQVLEGKEYKSKATIEGQAKITDFLVEDLLVLKEGAKIMYLKNEGDLVNGTIGEFQIINGKWSFVWGENKQYTRKLEKSDFEKWEYKMIAGNFKLVKSGTITQIPVKLAYALTIHKSQGLTFSEVTIDFTQPFFAKGQMYTALSRVTGPEGLKLRV